MAAFCIDKTNCRRQVLLTFLDDIELLKFDRVLDCNKHCDNCKAKLVITELEVGKQVHFIREILTYLRNKEMCTAFVQDLIAQAPLQEGNLENSDILRFIRVLEDKKILTV